VGTSASEQLRTVCNGDRPAGVPLWAQADDLVARIKRRALRIIALAAVVLVATSIASNVIYAENAPASPSTVASAQQALPELRYVRTLPAASESYSFGMFQSGTYRLAWSPDGERLATYTRSGLAITTWSPDGKYQYEFPRHGFGPIGIH
jgi:peptidoglycan/LPS O-acetylase OafA/YrhL